MGRIDAVLTRFPLLALLAVLLFVFAGWGWYFGVPFLLGMKRWSPLWLLPFAAGSTAVTLLASLKETKQRIEETRRAFGPLRTFWLEAVRDPLTIAAACLVPYLIGRYLA